MLRTSDAVLTARRGAGRWWGLAWACSCPVVSAAEVDPGTHLRARITRVQRSMARATTRHDNRRHGASAPPSAGAAALSRTPIRGQRGRPSTSKRCRSGVVSQWGMVSDPGQSKSNSRDPCRGSLTRIVTKGRGGKQMAHLDTHHQTTSGLQRSMQWHDRARGHGIVQGGIARPGMEPDRAAIPL